MRRVVSLFILSLFLFISINGFGTSQINFETHDSSSTTQEKLTITNGEYDEHSTFQTNNLFSNKDSIFSVQINEHDKYMSYPELSMNLQEMAGEFNKILKLYDNRGTSYEDRTLWMVKISDDPNLNEESEPEVLFVGAHHGDEAIGNELAIYIIEMFTSGYQRDPRITWLVDNHEIWVVPMLNPDGWEYTQSTENWRKNRSPNYFSEVTPGPFDPKIIVSSYGTDLNRNYDYEWGDPGGSSVVLQRSGTYAGSEPFSELETRAIRDLVLAHNFSFYMDYHSGIELILYPWGYTEAPTPDNALFERVAAELSRLTGYEARQGYDLYQTNGDSLDWVYSASRALAFTVELSSPKMPDTDLIQGILDNNIKQPLYLTGISGNPELGSRIGITHKKLENQTDKGPIPVSAIVTGIPSLTDLDVQLYYQVDDDDYKIINMKNSESAVGEYTCEIPTQAPGRAVKYFIVVKGEGILKSSPDQPFINRFYIEASPESIVTNSEIMAMVIMMIIIMGFFWGGFAYASHIAIQAEQRKLHGYLYNDDNYFEPGRGYRQGQRDSIFVSILKKLRIYNIFR